MEKVIVGGEEFEVINPGTENEFVKGCFGNRYRDAVEREIREHPEKTKEFIKIHPIEIKGA